MGIDLTNLRTAFFAMEEAEDLFSLQAEDGTFYWDIVRFSVFVGLQCAYGGPFNNPVAMKKASLLSKSKNAIKMFLNRTTRDYLAGQKPDYIFYTVQRTRIGSQLVDTVSDPLFDLVSENSIAIEAMNKESISFLDILMGRQTRVPSVFVYDPPAKGRLNKMAGEISARLARHFDRPVDIENLIWEPIAVYKQYKEHFLAVFARHKPKAVIVVNNGPLKGLFSAAKDMDVPTLELQHGASSIDSPFWSYPNTILSSHPGLTLPTAYLTFSDYWKSITHFPVRQTHSIGNDYLYQSPVRNSADSVAIISAYMYQDDLARLAVDLAESLPARIVYFKLHPHQFARKAAIAEQFKHRSNIVVLSDGMSLSDLFMECTFVVGVHSTVLYSALQARKKVMIYKKANYFFLHDIFEFVELFDNASEAESIIRTHEVRFKNLNQAPVFFVPLDSTAFMKALEAVRASATTNSPAL